MRRQEFQNAVVSLSVRAPCRRSQTTCLGALCATLIACLYAARTLTRSSWVQPWCGRPWVIHSVWISIDLSLNLVRSSVHHNFSTPFFWRGNEASACFRHFIMASYSRCNAAWQAASSHLHLLVQQIAISGKGSFSVNLFCCSRQIRSVIYDLKWVYPILEMKQRFV